MSNNTDYAEDCIQQALRRLKQQEFTQAIDCLTNAIGFLAEAADEAEWLINEHFRLSYNNDIVLSWWQASQCERSMMTRAEQHGVSGYLVLRVANTIAKLDGVKREDKHTAEAIQYLATGGLDAALEEIKRHQACVNHEVERLEKIIAAWDEE
jgi:hypothetical protein